MREWLNKKRRAITVLGIGLLSAVPAWAETSNVQAAVGGGVRWFDWREYSGNEQLLKETGPVFSLAGDLRLERDQLLFRLQSEGGMGIVHYDGQLQGSGDPYQARAWEVTLDTEAQVGRLMPNGDMHIGLMHRYWHRFIEGSATVSSAKEEYQWLLLLVGTEAALAPTWRLYSDVGMTVLSDQTVYSRTFGNFALEPGGGLFWRLGLRTKRGDTQWNTYLQYQEIKQSKAVARTNQFTNQQSFLFQPASERLELGLTVLVPFNW